MSTTSNAQDAETQVFESAQDLGMEEAFGQGLIEGPRQDLPAEPVTASELQARTDFTQGPK